jgi:hypothetical protein
MRHRKISGVQAIKSEVILMCLSLVTAQFLTFTSICGAWKTSGVSSGTGDIGDLRGVGGGIVDRGGVVWDP